MAKVIDEQLSLLLASEYASGKTAQQVGDEYGCCLATVLNHARKHGVPIRPRGAYQPQRKYRLNEFFFRQPSPDREYILGLIATDGSLASNGVIRIYQKDTSILQKIAATLEYDGPISTSTPVPCLKLCSAKMLLDLQQHGFAPGNKTHTVQVPTTIFFRADFVRGVFDGDGWGNWYQRGKRLAPHIGFVSGSHAFLIGLTEIIPFPLRGPRADTNSHTWSLYTTTIHSFLALRDWMYSSPSQLYLERKKAKLYR